MKKKFLKIYFIFIILLIYPILAKGESNPFSKKLIKEVPVSQGQTTSQTNTSVNINEENNVHPLLKYNLNRYFVKGVLIVNGGKYKNRALTIISAAGESDHLIQVGDSISDEWPQWTVSEIDIRSVIFKKRDGDELDENGEPILLIEKIQVLNPLSSKVDN